MVKRVANEAHRRSGRICAPEERARKQRTNGSAGTSLSAPVASRRRGRKSKSFLSVVNQSLTNLHDQGAINLIINDSAAQPHQLASPQPMPTKQLLESFLDMLQRSDQYEIFAQPVNGQEVVEYYNIIEEPMDFGTMRAKLQEGLYTSFNQFEHDVFLISSNAMKFNAPNTEYYKEARALGILAQRLFHGLRTEPENFEVELTCTRRCHGRRAQSQNSNSCAPVPNSNDNNASASGSQNVGNLSSCEIDKHMTYMPQSICSENEKMVSAFLDASKSLQPVQVNTAATQYTDSLLQFVEDIGPQVQTIANGNFPTQAPENPFPSPNLGFSPKPTAFQNPAFVNEGVSSNFPCDTVSKYSSAYKGKAVCIDSDFHASKPNTTDWIGNHNSVENEGNNSTENVDLLFATLLQINNIQKGEGLRSPAPHLLGQTYIPRSPQPMGSGQLDRERPSLTAPTGLNQAGQDGSYAAGPATFQPVRLMQPNGMGPPPIPAEQVTPKSRDSGFNPIDFLAGAYQQPQPDARKLWPA